MSTRKLVVVGAIGGLLFIPLLAAAVSVFDLAVPQVSLPDAEFASEFAKSQRTLRVVAFLWALTGTAFFSFVGSNHMGSPRHDHGDRLAEVALMAGALWAFTWVLAGLVLGGALSLEASAESASQAKSAVAIARNLSFSHDLLLAAVFVGAAALATPRGTGIRGWIRKTGVGAAAGLVLGSVALAIGQPFPILPLGMLLLLVWIVATSVQLIRSDSQY